MHVLSSPVIPTSDPAEIELTPPSTYMKSFESPTVTQLLATVPPIASPTPTQSTLSDGDAKSISTASSPRQRTARLLVHPYHPLHGHKAVEMAAGPPFSAPMRRKDRRARLRALTEAKLRDGEAGATLSNRAEPFGAPVTQHADVLEALDTLKRKTAHMAASLAEHENLIHRIEELVSNM